MPMYKEFIYYYYYYFFGIASRKVLSLAFIGLS